MLKIIYMLVEEVNSMRKGGRRGHRFERQTSRVYRRFEEKRGKKAKQIVHGVGCEFFYSYSEDSIKNS